VSSLTRDEPEVNQRGLAQFGRVRIRPAYHDVVALLIDAIRSGYFVVGEKLPSERELATELAVSLPVVREALDVLEDAGLVEVRRGRSGGTTLVSLVGIPELLAELQGDAPEALEELLEARRVIEHEACSLAARRAQPHQLAALQAIVTEALAARNDLEELAELTVRYHVRVAALSGNAVLAELTRMIANRMAVAGLRAGARLTPSAHARICEVMNELVDAMGRNDAQAIGALVDEHLEIVRAALPRQDQP
jgi:GntR family transcriptional repressor for pyruvate dehydrogenase complex